MELVKKAWKVQMPPDSFQRWHVTIAHSLLITKIQKSENYLIVTEKISISPQPHVGIMLIGILKYKNTPNIQYIKTKYPVSLCMHIAKATYTICR